MVTELPQREMGQIELWVFKISAVKRYRPNEFNRTS